MPQFSKSVVVFAISLPLWVISTAAYADSPLAQIQGELTPEIRELLTDVIGEAEAPPRSLAQARRRAKTAATQATSVMRSQGYYGADIQVRIEEFTPQSGEAVRRPPQPVLTITPGPQFTFSQITIWYDGNTPDSDVNIADVINLRSGSAALAAQVVAAELRAVNYLTANGYPETVVLPREAIVDHDTNTMSVEFRLSIGDKTRFGSIEQTGSADLRKSWPKMISPFKNGDIFNSGQLNTLSSRVVATGAFDSATAVLDEDKTPNGDGTVTRNVVLNIEQGAMNTVTGEIGYSTTDGSGIDVSYERRNFIGYAQTLTLSTTIKTNQIKIGADYNIPYMFSDDRSVDLSAVIARENTDAFSGERVGGDALITRKISNRLKVGIGAGLEASRFKENGLDVTAYLFDGLATATYDSRNSILDPVKGVHLEGSAVPTYNFGKNDGLFTTVQMAGSTYHRVSETLVVAGRVKAGTIFGADINNVPLNRRFYGGGGGSIRGYGYQSVSPVNAQGELVGGRSIAEASAELRYRGDSPFGAAVFIDAGSVVRGDLPSVDNIRYGAGIGIRYYTSFAPLRADIAIPLNKRGEDDDFQIYLSIGQAF